MLLQEFAKNPINAIIWLLIIIVSLTIHEAAHAYSAYWLGDKTPKAQNRLTFNPKAHIDPWGLLFIVVAGIGWGRPVQFNPYNLKNPRRDTALIAVAGPISNIVLAFIAVLSIFVLETANLVSIDVLNILLQVVFLNIALAVFNMLPIEPLDGFKVVGGILPGSLALQWYETAKYGIYLLLFLMISGGIDRIVYPVSRFILNLLILPFSI